MERRRNVRFDSCQTKNACRRIADTRHCKGPIRSKASVCLGQKHTSPIQPLQTKFPPKMTGRGLYQYFWSLIHPAPLDSLVVFPRARDSHLFSDEASLTLDRRYRRSLSNACMLHVTPAIGRNHRIGEIRIPVTFRKDAAGRRSVWRAALKCPARVADQADTLSRSGRLCGQISAPTCGLPRENLSRGRQWLNQGSACVECRTFCWVSQLSDASQVTTRIPENDWPSARLSGQRKQPGVEYRLALSF